MNRLDDSLQRGRNGNAILFCGAGMTADCLGFDDDAVVGITYHLLNLLNSQLKENGKQSGFTDIKNAAKRYKNELGVHRLIELLKHRFQLSNISQSIVDIIQYPWSAVYTTNYDNGLEIACQTSRKKYQTLSNLTDASTATDNTPIIHLHGYAQEWTISNFEQTCILDVDSYRTLPNLDQWLNRLRFDIERAQIVVFIGFSAADFHLANVFFYSAGLREKAFFINRPTANPSVDEKATQEDFGQPLYIGREDFATVISKILTQDAPIEPRLSSFRRYQSILGSDTIPSVQDIEDLFIWGKVNFAHLKRDQNLSKSDYHVLRDSSIKLASELAASGKVVLVNGDICDGKTIIIQDAMSIIAASRPTFELRHAYVDLLNEASSILSIYPTALLIVENCFSLSEERLLGLARLISASLGGLVLSARIISTDAETAKLRSLRKLPSLNEITLDKLRPDEIDSLISLIDQLAGWHDFRGLSHSDRRKFVEQDCKAILPSVLLRLLNSDYVQAKYREEYNKTLDINERDRQMIIGALLISNIGLDAPISFLSNIFRCDFGAVLKKISVQQGGLRLIHADANFVRTLPSIGARNLLKSVISPSDIVNASAFILQRMATSERRSDFERHLFSQLMRYSILSSIIHDATEINRFFDYVSKIDFYRTMPLFWLQWHMAMSAQHLWEKADSHLEMSYKMAEAYEKRSKLKYDRKQLEDRKAKFLVARAKFNLRSGAELFRDLRTALGIVFRLMMDFEITHHPFETLLEIVLLLKLQSHTLIDDQQKTLKKLINELESRAEVKVSAVSEGYQRSKAKEWMKQSKLIIAELNSP